MKKGIIIFILILCGCSNKILNKGVIVDMWYTPTHSYTTYIMCGKVMMPIENYAPDAWTVEIIVKLNGESIIYDIDVPQSDYNSWNINDTIKIKK